MRKGDWQIIHSKCGGRPYQAFEMGRGQMLYYRRSLDSEEEVQKFVQTEHLALIETTQQGTWPARNYRRRVRQAIAHRNT